MLQSKQNSQNLPQVSFCTGWPEPFVLLTICTEKVQLICKVLCCNVRPQTYLFSTVKYPIFPFSFAQMQTQNMLSITFF